MMRDYSDPIRAVYAACVDECMAALCRHFNTKAGGYSGTFAYQTAMLAELGAVRREVADIIARHTYGVDGMVSEAVRTAMLKAVKEVEPSLVAAVKAGVVDGTDVPISDSIQSALSSYSRQAVDQLNLVNTVMLESCLNNYRALVSNTAAYEAQLDRAQQILNSETGKVITGVSSHQQAVRQAVQQFARTGLTVFTDKAGHRWSPEAYAAMDVRTTVNNAARQAVLDRNEDYGNDLVSVPINATARPKCYPWQGKVISTANEARTVTDLHDRPVRVYAISETTYGEPDGLWGINCHHQPSPFFAGLSVLRGEVPEKQDNDALYALTQQQRRLERDVRNLKREAVMLDAAGDEDGTRDSAAKARHAQQRLKTFCETNNLPLRSDRTQVLGYNKSISQKGRIASGLTREKKAEQHRVIDKAIHDAQPTFCGGAYRVNVMEVIRKNTSDGWYGVGLHGTPRQVQMYGTKVNADVLADALRQRKDYHGEPVRLFACSTGCADTQGRCFAQSLANQLGIAVEAPDNTIWAYSDGSYTIGELPTDNTGQMITYYPKKR